MDSRGEPRTDGRTVIQQIMCAQSPETFQKVGNRDGSHIESQNRRGVADRSERNELKFAGGNGARETQSPPLVPRTPRFANEDRSSPVITIRTKLCRIGERPRGCVKYLISAGSSLRMRQWTTANSLYEACPPQPRVAT